MYQLLESISWPLMRLILATLILLSGCSAFDSNPEGSLRVLFVGNSLTYVNDLPAVTAAMAESQGHRLVYETYAFPGISLESQWYEGRARSALEEGSWDVVIMQQGPSGLKADREHLREWVSRWSEEARLHGTEPAVYMVWPDGPIGAFENVIRSYTEAAEASDALLLPVGAAWLAGLERDSNLPLHGPDHFHPSETGTYLAALTIYGGLFNAPVDDIPNALSLEDDRRIAVSMSDGPLLREVAAEVLANQ